MDKKIRKGFILSEVIAERIKYIQKNRGMNTATDVIIYAINEIYERTKNRDSDLILSDS